MQTESAASSFDALFERKLRAMSVPGVDLITIDIALADSRDGFARVQRAMLPRISHLDRSDYAAWLDALVELKLELSHITRHLDAADEQLQNLILGIQERAPRE
jgi:hypothetical protein